MADSNDTGVDQVIHAIGQHENVSAHRVDPNDIGDGTTFLTAQIVGKSATFCVASKQGHTQADQIRSVWWRPPASTLDGWGTLEALLYTCPDLFWIGSPERTHALSSPARNFLMAARAGLQTPKVEIHAEPGALFEVMGRWGGRVRMLSWGGYPFGTGGGIDDLMAAQPVIFQQDVRDATHRVTVVYVHGQTFAGRAELPDSPLRFKSDPPRRPQPMEAFFDLPESIVKSVARLCQMFMGGTFLGLKYLMLHFLVADDQWVFDTVEPCGDFWPLEEATRQPISQAVANLLVTGQAWE
ncbi:hypothetical protein ABZ726_01680 [Streptomyces hundungensis]|uniref:hypothetical protein n=1 Tax=Streptomyces hundungensis TaxID=1077946 RepID=UPI00340FB5F5